MLEREGIGRGGGSKRRDERSDGRRVSEAERKTDEWEVAPARRTTERCVPHREILVVDKRLCKLSELKGFGSSKKVDTRAMKCVRFSIYILTQSNLLRYTKVIVDR